MSRQPTREQGSSTHNPEDPMCAQRDDEAYVGEDFGQVCWVCHHRSEARRAFHAAMAREIGS